MHQELIEFSYLGARDYVHSSDIVPAVLSRLPAGIVKKFDIRFSGKIDQTLRLVFDTPFESQDAKVSGLFLLDGEPRRFRLYQTGEKVTQRIAYDESSLVASSALDVSAQAITLERDVGHGLFRILTALQKALLGSLYPQAKGKWVCTRIELKEVPELAYPVRLKFSRNLNFQIVRSEVFVAGHSVGFISFTLVGETQW